MKLTKVAHLCLAIPLLCGNTLAQQAKLTFTGYFRVWDEGHARGRGWRSHQPALHQHHYDETFCP